MIFRKTTFRKKSSLSIMFSGLLLTSTLLVAANNDILATVNGQTISTEQLNLAASQSKIKPADLTPEQKKMLVDALINRQLVMQEAAKEGYAKKPEVVLRVNALTESYIAASYLAEKAKEIKIDDKELQDYYDKNVLKNTPKEYQARHILVKTEAEAQSLIKEIEAGADFSKLAKEKSIDAGSGAKGGELGWFTAQNMVAPFSQAVSGLKKGELSKTPIQSDFGWHVIILDDERSLKPAEYEKVKIEIEKIILKQRLNEYILGLNARADIKRN
jgi:peptidyl-prolyl cis-trans isomerase C